MINLQSALPKLNSPKTDAAGNTWAFCPCHADGTKHNRRSLKLSESGGKLLIHCFAGCKFSDISAALELKPSGSNHHEPEMVYSYVDEREQLLFQVCRMPGKRFMQRRPDGNGGWIWKLIDTRRVLYRLPELIQAVKRGDTIFICEGEKDADCLRGLGLTATTNSGGAGKWRPEYNEPLAAAKVIVIPDNDEPGRKHADQVAESLRGAAASVKVLKLSGLAEKGDVSDWLSAGGTRDELLKLAADCGEWAAAEKRGRQRKEKQKQDERETRQTSFFTAGNLLYEQLYINGKGMFLAYDSETGEAEIIPFLASEEEIIEPINSEDVTLGAVKLPSGTEEYSETLNLLSEIEAHIYRYLDVSPSYLKFAAYYVLLSWLYDRFHTLPYLRALGDTGCGKSRFLDVIGGLCYKVISASGCVTPAPIYRMLRKWGGTLVLDEADMKNSDEYNEVVTILNCGFERGRPVIRATKDNPDKIQILPVYGPKVFATRRRFKDAALEARCLTEVMVETDRDDIPAVLGRTFFDEQQLLRNKLLLYRLRNYSKVEPDAAVLLQIDGIEPRLRQVSESIMALFADEPEVLSSYRFFIQTHQRELIEQRASTKIGQVVDTLFRLMENKMFHVPTVPSYMVDSELGTGISAGDIGEATGITAQAAGAILKGLGLETKRMRHNGENKRVILYNRSRFEKLRKRYILPEYDETEDPENVPTSLSANTLGTLGTLEQGNLMEVIV